MRLQSNFAKIVSSIALLSLFPECAYSMPEGISPEEGKVDFGSSKKRMTLRVSDKAIINYENFSIGKREKVTFKQPSSSSVVLNRVQGNNISEIFGRLKSNGRILLVNPQGVFFGPSAQVNIGSIVVSTLDISSQDFLQGKFRFILSEAGRGSRIINQGKIIASKEGSIALLAPVIQNEGFIEAKAGKVLLAAAERVALDFTGDGLLSFSVDGAIEKACITQSGKIEASGGDVYLKLKVAEKAIKAVVNTDGVEEGEFFLEENGIIKLVSSSYIAANKISIDGGAASRIDIGGSLQAQSGDKGGRIALTGDAIQIVRAHINASGDNGGGEIFIGGDFQGEGPLCKANDMRIGPGSVIQADAISSGNGGKIVVWSEGNLSLSSVISSKGGGSWGSGGLIETSAGAGFHTGESFAIHLSAPSGAHGVWLIDPQSITVSAKGLDSFARQSLNRPRSIISPATLTASSGNIIFCCEDSVTIDDPISLTADRTSITFLSPKESKNNTTLNAGISTNKGPIVFSNNTTGLSNVVLGADVTLSTGAGAPVIFQGNISGAHDLVVKAGTSNVHFANSSKVCIGSVSSTISLDVTQQNPLELATSSIALAGGLRVRNHLGVPLSVSIASTLSVGGACSIGGLHASAGEYGVALGGGGTISGPVTFANSGAIALSGGSSSLIVASSLDTTSGSSTHYSGDIYIARAGGSLTSNTVVLDGNTTLRTESGEMNFIGDISGAFDLSLNSGAASITIADRSKINIGSGPATLSLDIISGSTNISLGDATKLAGGLRVRNKDLAPSDVAIHGPLAIAGPISVGALTTANGPFAVSITGGGHIYGQTQFNNTAELSLGGAPHNALQFAHDLSVAAASELHLSGALHLTGCADATFSVPIHLAQDTIVSTASGNIFVGASISGAHNLALHAQEASIITGPGVSLHIGNDPKKISLDLRSSAAVILHGPAYLTGGLRVFSDTQMPQALVATSTLSVGGEITVGDFFTGPGAFDICLLGGGTIKGSTTLQNSGQLFLYGSTEGLSLYEDLDANLCSSTHLGGSIHQRGNERSVTMGSVVLDADTTLQTNNGRIKIEGASVTGAHNLVLDPGHSTVHFGSATNINIGDVPENTSLTIKGCGSDIEFHALALAGGLTAVSSSLGTLDVVFHDTTVIGGAIHAGALETAALPFDISLLGGGTIFGATRFANTGHITLYGSTAGLTFCDPLDTTSASSTHLSGAVRLIHAADSIHMGVIVLDADASILTNKGDILFNSTIDGVHAFVVKAPSADVTLSGTVGGLAPLTSFTGYASTITQRSDIHALKEISYTPTAMLHLNGNMITEGGLIHVSGPTTIFSHATIDTTGSSCCGADITFDSIDACAAGVQSLTLAAGPSGRIALGAVGEQNPIGNLTISSTHSVMLHGSITTHGGIISIPQPTFVASSVSLTTTGSDAVSGASIVLGPVDAATHSSSAGALRLNAGREGSIVLGAVGGVHPLGMFDVINATAVTIGGDVTVRGDAAAGGSICIIPSISLGADSTLSTTGRGVARGNSITLGAIDGARALVIDAGSEGSVQFGEIGKEVPLTRLRVQGVGVMQNASVTTTGDVCYSGAGQIVINGNITTDGGGVTWNKPAIVCASIEVDTTNAGRNTSGGAIRFDTVDALTSSAAAEHITLNAGTDGSIILGDIGSLMPMGLLSVADAKEIVAASIAIRGDAIGGGALIIDQPVKIAGDAIFTTTAGGVAAGNTIVLSTVDGAHALTIDAGASGAAQFNAIGAAIPVRSLAVTGSKVSQKATVDASGSITYTGPSGIFIGGDLTTLGGAVTWNSPAELTATVEVDTTKRGLYAPGADITLGDVDATNFSSNAEKLTLNAGTNGKVTLGVVGGRVPLGLVGISHAREVITASITVRGDAIGGGTIGIAQPVMLADDAIFTTTGAGVAEGNNILLGTVDGAHALTIDAGTRGAAQFDAIGEKTPAARLDVKGSIVKQNATVKTRGSVTYTAPDAIHIGGDVTTSGGAVTCNNPATLTAPSQIDTTEGGAVPLGGDVKLSDVDGGQLLVINTGTGGSLQYGAIEEKTPPTVITVTRSSAEQGVTIKTNEEHTVCEPAVRKIEQEPLSSVEDKLSNETKTPSTVIKVDVTENEPFYKDVDTTLSDSSKTTYADDDNSLEDAATASGITTTAVDEALVENLLKDENITATQSDKVQQLEKDSIVVEGPINVAHNMPNGEEPILQSAGDAAESDITKDVWSPSNTLVISTAAAQMPRSSSIPEEISAENFFVNGSRAQTVSILGAELTSYIKVPETYTASRHKAYDHLIAWNHPEEARVPTPADSISTFVSAEEASIAAPSAGVSSPGIQFITLRTRSGGSIVVGDLVSSSAIYDAGVLTGWGGADSLAGANCTACSDSRGNDVLLPGSRSFSVYGSDMVFIGTLYGPSTMLSFTLERGELFLDPVPSASASIASAIISNLIVGDMIDVKSIKLTSSAPSSLGCFHTPFSITNDALISPWDGISFQKAYFEGGSGKDLSADYPHSPYKGSVARPPPLVSTTLSIAPRLLYVLGIYSTDNNFSAYLCCMPYFYTWDVLNFSSLVPMQYGGRLTTTMKQESWPFLVEVFLFSSWGVY